MPIELAACNECGAEFTARANASYCSPACRQKAYLRLRNGGRNGPRPATIDSLIATLETTTAALENHTAAMNYRGTDEFNVHTLDRHPFDDNAHEILHALSQRIDEVSNDLGSAEDERKSYEAPSPRQQESRTHEADEHAHDAQAGAVRDAE